jgi:hypothetical protein
LTAKQGEYLAMKRMGFSSLMWTMTYDEVFNGEPAHMQALLELFPPGGDVGAVGGLYQSNLTAN